MQNSFDYLKYYQKKEILQILKKNLDKIIFLTIFCIKITEVKK